MPPPDRWEIMTELQDFVASAHAWLRIVAEPEELVVSGAGSDNVDLLPSWDVETERAEVQAARKWLALRQSAGYGGVSFPVELGGRGLSAAHDFAYQLAEGHYRIPSNEVWNIGFGMVMPTIVAAGTAAQRERFVGPGLRGDLLFCQLFSEPEAGSDLGSLRTRATRDDFGWVIRGGKVWTSMARAADFGLLLARTGPDGVSRRVAFTTFLVPMSAPGITITPIRQITGGMNFSEVVFDDVVVPDDLRLGPVGDGWAIAMTTLGHEHVALPLAGPAGSVDRLTTLARQLGCAGDALVRDDLAMLYIRRRILDLNAERTLAALTAGEPPGPEGSIAKLVATDFLTAISEFTSAVLGPLLVTETGACDTTAWASHMLGAVGLHIGGGTDEIQRNMLAERVLGLPRAAR